MGFLMQTVLGANGQIAVELTRELYRSHTHDIRLVSRHPQKVHDTDELVAAALDVAAGRTALSPQVQQRLVQRTMDPHAALSPRETDILQQVATGASNREVARALFISESTVKTHLAHLFAKLGVDNRTALVAVARQRRLIR